MEIRCTSLNDDGCYSLMNCFSIEFISYKYRSFPLAPKGGKLPAISSETMPCTRDQMTMATDRESRSTSPPCIFHISKLILYSGFTWGKDMTFNFPVVRSCSTTLTRALSERAAEGKTSISGDSYPGMGVPKIS